MKKSIPLTFSYLRQNKVDLPSSICLPQRKSKRQNMAKTMKLYSLLNQRVKKKRSADRLKTRANKNQTTPHFLQLPINSLGRLMMPFLSDVLIFC